MAWAPKLRWRVYGVFGMVLAESSSSTAFSSMDSEFVVEILPRRRPNGELADCGEVPERPKVVTERRRRWSRAAAAAAESLAGTLPVEVELLRWKRFDNAAEVTEPRRPAAPLGGELFEPSLDMINEETMTVPTPTKD